MTDKEAPRVYELAGRRFRAVAKPTVDWMIAASNELRLAKVDKFVKAEKEDNAQFAERFVDQVQASGRLVDLAAVLVVPAEIDDADWTPAMHQQTRRLFGRLQDEADQIKLFHMLEEVFRFFVYARLYSMPSRTATQQPGAARNAGAWSRKAAAANS